MARKDLSELAPFVVILAVMILLATAAISKARQQSPDNSSSRGLEMGSFEQASLDAAWEMSRR